MQPKKAKTSRAFITKIRARSRCCHLQAFWEQHVTRKFGVIAAVTRLRIGDHSARFVGVARNRAARLVSPAIGVLAVPVIVLARPDNKGHQAAGLFAVRKAVGDLVRAVALGGSAHVSSGDGREP